ncbi:MAG: hypothetical protein DYH03_07980 [Nitrospira sp. NTP1]|nr:hypothetical protein [Nitrospira sp. NTP1]
MYEEPYRWIEAVGNRRQYLDEQFTMGSPVIALRSVEWDIRPIWRNCGSRSWKWLMSKGSIVRHPMLQGRD